MSSKAVRDAFRASWSTAVPDIDFYETVNDDPDHSTIPALWATAEFQSYNDEPITLGNPACYRETGIITVVLATTAGIGDDDLLVAAEKVRDAYRHWRSGDIRVVQVDPPLNEGFSDGNYYIMDVDISYVYDTNL